MNPRITTSLLLLALTACQSASAPAAQQAKRGEAVALAYLETAVFDGRLRVQFAGIVEDSRCPRDVACFWQGQVTVRLAISSGPAQPRSLDVVAGQSAVADSYQLTIPEVYPPHPASDKKLAVQDYRILLKAE